MGIKKQCIILETEHGYTWNGRAECNCIMAKIKNRTLDNLQLQQLQGLNSRMISSQEYKAIRGLDFEQGNEYDLIHIRNIAKRNNIKIVIKMEN